MAFLSITVGSQHGGLPDGGNVIFRNAVDPDLARLYRDNGWWGDVTLADHVRRHAQERPDKIAYWSEYGSLTWAELHRVSNRIASVLTDSHLTEGGRVAVYYPDSATIHAVFLGIEKAGLVTVGIGSRAGLREIAHILSVTGADTLVTTSFDFRGRDADQLVAELKAYDVELKRVVLVDRLESRPEAPIIVNGHAEDGSNDFEPEHPIRPDDLFLINSTSGTTSLPKCVLHTQNRWIYFHQLAERNGDLTPDDVFFGAIPAPFGFGLWTAHFSPIILGSSTLVTEKFDSTKAIQQIIDKKVSVLCCVSTQFLMLLNDPSFEAADLSSLRVMYTGGEAVPAARAMDFENRSGCKVLQFYGSNETGVLSGTRLTDTDRVRFETAGYVEADMNVRLFDESGRTIVTGSGRPACKGPATCIGYLDEEANSQLFTDDGWMLMGDICSIDDDGLLRVTGRTSDIIIRGGKNISAPQVEDEVSSHPAIALAAAVAKPDPVFGERVFVFVELASGAAPITHDQLKEFLVTRGTSVELIPEGMAIVPELPRSSGGKLAKGELRKLVKSQEL